MNEEKRDIAILGTAQKMERAIGGIDHEFRAVCGSCQKMVEDEELPPESRTAWWAQTKNEAQQIADVHNSSHEGHTCIVKGVW